MSRLGEMGMLAAFYLNVQIIRDLGKQGLRSLSKLSERNHTSISVLFTVGHMLLDVASAGGNGQRQWWW